MTQKEFETLQFSFSQISEPLGQTDADSQKLHLTFAHHEFDKVITGSGLFQMGAYT